MEGTALEELSRRRKDQTLRLIEIADITHRIDEAVERKDEVSVQLLLGERELPLRQLCEIEEGIQAYLLTLPESEAIRMNELLRGAEAGSMAEEPLAEQTAQYRRMLDSTAALDKRVSVGFGGSRSFYKKIRES